MNNNKLYNQHFPSVMQDRDFFFKPYRQRISQMNQHHDQLEDGSLQQYPQKKTYFGHSPKARYVQLNYKQTKPSKYSPQSNSKNPMKQYDYNKNRKHTKLDRQMHQPVWEHLYNQGLRLHKQIEQVHKQKQFQIDTECTFQPMIRKSSRYRIPTSSNFLQRSYLWQQNKLQKIVKEKQQEVVKDLENCTFKPQLNRYKLTSNKYHHLNPSKSMTALKNKNQHKKQQSSPNLYKKQKQKQRKPNDFNREEVGKIKNIIRTELQRIQL